MSESVRDEALRLWEQVNTDPESGWRWELDIGNEAEIGVVMRLIAVGRQCPGWTELMDDLLHYFESPSHEWSAEQEANLTARLRGARKAAAPNPT